jgi:hypothetical protein
LACFPCMVTPSCLCLSTRMRTAYLDNNATSQEPCQGKSSRRPAPRLHCATKGDLRISRRSPHGARPKGQRRSPTGCRCHRYAPRRSSRLCGGGVWSASHTVWCSARWMVSTRCWRPTAGRATQRVWNVSTALSASPWPQWGDVLPPYARPERGRRAAAARPAPLLRQLWHAAYPHTPAAGTAGARQRHGLREAVTALYAGDGRRPHQPRVDCR